MNSPACKSLINGVAAAYLDINDRAIHYGDGLFETILCSNKKLYYWEQHYQRLRLSSNRLQISCPDKQQLLDDIHGLMRLNSDTAGDSFAVKIILTRGKGERGYRFEKANNTNRIVLLSPVEKTYSSLLSSELLAGELVFCTQQVSINENLAGLKHLNRLENVMARNEWNDSPDIIDGLMMNADGFVIEGTMSNLFAVKEGQLFTPELYRSGVNGVMRDVIINIALENNIAVTFSDLTPDYLTGMDELFISNSLIGVKRVEKLDHIHYRQADVTKFIFKKLLDINNDHVQVIE